MIPLDFTTVFSKRKGASTI